MSEKVKYLREHHNIQTELLPDYARWISFNPGYSLSTYVRSELKLEHFFAVASILSPPLIRYHDGLFLEDGFDPSRFASWLQQNNGDITRVERVMNHRHIRNISQSLKEAPFPIVLSAGKIIRNCLEAWLRYVHPDINTEVDMVCAHDDVEVTFVSKRSSDTGAS